ncbi:MAG TPA: hypothetical protein V6C99_08670 [Oculatellaceae cyanobacterium]|jgi:predicted amidophosphoribosyltransferase
MSGDFPVITNCKQCQKPFKQVTPNTRLCSECIKLREIQYHRVYRYIIDHPDTTIAAVVEETETPEAVVLEMIQQGRIQLSGEALVCAQCKQNIPEQQLNARLHNGRIYCMQCLSKLSERLQYAVSLPEADSTAKGDGDKVKRYGLGRGDPGGPKGG